MVDADGGVGQPGRVAARVGAGLPGVRARVWLLEKGLGQDLFPPRAGLGVHHRVEESLQVRVQILGDMDHLLARRGRDGGRVHFPTWRWQGLFLQEALAEQEGQDRAFRERPANFQPPSPPVLPQSYSTGGVNRSKPAPLLLRDARQSSNDPNKFLRPLLQRPSRNPKAAASAFP